jgi:hypothetical protein
MSTVVDAAGTLEVDLPGLATALLGGTRSRTLPSTTLSFEATRPVASPVSSRLMFSSPASSGVRSAL